MQGANNVWEPERYPRRSQGLQPAAYVSFASFPNKACLLKPMLGGAGSPLLGEADLEELSRELKKKKGYLFSLLPSSAAAAALSPPCCNGAGM